MAEEGCLEQLLAGARRRRQLDHHQLVECLLQERRALRAKLMKQHQLQDKEEWVYNQLRLDILSFIEIFLYMIFISRKLSV